MHQRFLYDRNWSERRQRKNDIRERERERA
jgi:hypothetical protein